mmetsp:Transcript_116861/g.377142  ORF Transcript_116861/g.377142 Transcript_116861/m.377142 type:complete len:205 (+) Transcript_116861:133-747(+)
MPAASARERSRLKPLLCSPEEGRPTSTSPAHMRASCGNGADRSTAPTAKPEMSKPLALKTPGISAVLELSSAQPASMQPSATPWFTCNACCMSSFGAARWAMMKMGSAPRAAMSLAQSATRSTPIVSNRSMTMATLSLVPTLFVPLTSIGSSYFRDAMLQSPARPVAPPSSESSSQPARCVRFIKGRMLALMACSMDRSTPAPR